MNSLLIAVALGTAVLFSMDAKSKLLQELSTMTVAECMITCVQRGICDGVVYDEPLESCRLMQGNESVTEWAFRRGVESSAEFHHFNRTPGCPSDEWLTFDLSDLCFVRVKILSTWNEARTACIDLGGDLTDLSSEGATAYLETLTNRRKYWVGANYKNGSYFWFGGGKMDDQIENPEDADPENCVSYYHHAIRVMRLKPCSDGMFFLCQKSRF